MAITIGNNIASLLAQRKLRESSDRLSRTYERLSSGMRINRAGDDAGAVALAANLTASVRSYTQGIRNINDGISLLSIADAALQSLSEVAFRQSELAAQAASTTLSAAQRQVLQKEADALTNEFNRIVAVTSFNGISLFSPDLQKLSIQVSDKSSITLNGLTSALQTVGTGSFTFSNAYATGGTTMDVEGADLDGDGDTDLVVGNGSPYLQVFLNNGNGTFQAPVNYAIDFYSITLEVADMNGDGKLDIVTSSGNSSLNISVLSGNGDGTFAAPVSYHAWGRQILDIKTGDFNSDGRVDTVSVSPPSDDFVVLLTGSDGLPDYSKLLIQGAPDQVSRVEVGDVNNDGKLDLVLNNGWTGTGNALSVMLGNGDGTFRQASTPAVGPSSDDIQLYDLNRDGNLDIVTGSPEEGVLYTLMGNGDGTFQAKTSYTIPLFGACGTKVQDLNGDGIGDIVTDGYNVSTYGVLLGNPDGTFQAVKTYTTPVANANGQLFVGDLTGDGVKDMVFSGATAGVIGVLFGDTSKTAGTQYLNLGSVTEATSSLNIARATIDRIAAARGSIGADMARLEVALQSNRSAKVNYESALDRITSVDMAEEISELTRLNMLQQTQIALLAHPSIDAQLILKLLKS